MSFFRLLLLTLSLLLTACTSYHTRQPLLRAAGGGLQKTWYQAEVKAPDGAMLRMTVYQPALAPGTSAPLLLHAHGFGLSRMARPFSLYGKVLLAGKSAIRAWDEGFWVISYDFRGQGDSGGHISLMDPDKEQRDVSTLIDWAQQNLAISQRDGHPQIGMIGESYGGGIQLSASQLDPRIRALVPITTWYDLDQSLFPNGVAKTDWLMFLGLVAYTRSPLAMDHSATVGTFKEIFGDGDPALRQRLYRNSPASQCAGGRRPFADALLIQGMRDVLFPFNNALGARACLLDAGRDVRLVAIEHGHLMPGSQWSPGLPVWYVQPQVQCDGRTLATMDIIDDWLRGKLMADSTALARVPRFCFTGDTAVDAALSHQPPTLSWVDLHAASNHNGTTGWLEFIARPLDYVVNSVMPECLSTGYRPPLGKQPMLGGQAYTPPAPCVDPDWNSVSNGWLRPARIPLLAVQQPTWIAGIPHIQLHFDAANRRHATVFLRLAAWRPNSGSYRVLSQQVTPATADGVHDFDLAAVRDRLEPGEVLGLLVQGHSNQFRLGGSGPGTSVTVSGRIGLPLMAASP